MFSFNFHKEIVKNCELSIKQCESQFKKIDEIVSKNQQKVLENFIDCRVSESHFSSTTGYGYGDCGRDTLDKLFALYFGSDDAIVRHNFVNGTHAISTALFGILRPGDKLLSLNGLPYDSLHDVIGISKNTGLGSLKDFGIDFDYANLKKDYTIDYDEISLKLKNKKVKVAYIQRSKGYTLAKSLSVFEIKKIIEFVKNINNDLIVVIDNCYGEFTENFEPTHVGADLIIGSLIKNPGGGIVRAGGYICGRKDLIQLCANRLTTVGAGKDVGATFGLNREMFLGFFNAPVVTGEALKSAVFASSIFEKLGYEVFPKWNDNRYDIVQAIKLETREKLVAFCKGIQAASPVDSFVVPEPWLMPNYSEKIIMAAGTFTNGASIELSADAPLREPFLVWVQGGLNFYSAKLGILNAANEVIKI